ncbi:MAG: protease SohB [Cellvibrionaceae bacterium]
MEFLAEYGLFLAKTVTFVVCILAVIIFAMAASHKGPKSDHGHIEVTKLNDIYKSMSDTLKSAVLDHHEIKQLLKEEKKKEKEQEASRKKEIKKQNKKNAEQIEKDHKKRVFVLNFDGDMKASATHQMREEITTVLSIADSKDEIVIRLESGGGMVHSYGLAASQLQRITKKKIPLTICIDKVAASGGYMMACVGNNILAAPFAIIGSIGVVAQLPNFHRLLKKNDIDFEMQTAGEYKRTLTMFAENTDKGREKFSEELEETHHLFKDFISENRPELDVDSVATGETWYGTKALENKLIDDVQTSDEYLTSLADTADILEVQYQQKKSLPEKLGMASQSAVDRLLLTWWERLQTTRFFS